MSRSRMAPVRRYELILGLVEGGLGADLTVYEPEPCGPSYLNVGPVTYQPGYEPKPPAETRTPMPPVNQMLDDQTATLAVPDRKDHKGNVVEPVSVDWHTTNSSLLVLTPSEDGRTCQAAVGQGLGGGDVTARATYPGGVTVDYNASFNVVADEAQALSDGLTDLGVTINPAPDEPGTGSGGTDSGTPTDPTDPNAPPVSPPDSGPPPVDPNLPPVAPTDPNAPPVDPNLPPVTPVDPNLPPTSPTDPGTQPFPPPAPPDAGTDSGTTPEPAAAPHVNPATGKVE